MIFSSPLIGCCDYFGFGFYLTQSSFARKTKHNDPIRTKTQTPLS